MRAARRRGSRAWAGHDKRTGGKAHGRHAADGTPNGRVRRKAGQLDGIHGIFLRKRLDILGPGLNGPAQTMRQKYGLGAASGGP